MNLPHFSVALKLSRPVERRSSALAEPQAKASQVLRSRPARSASVALSETSGKSPEQAARGIRNHRSTAFQAQLAPALARHRGQMLVSQWALPLSEGRRALDGTVSSGSGAGGVQALPRFFTASDAQPFVQADGFAAA